MKRHGRSKSRNPQGHGRKDTSRGKPKYIKKYDMLSLQQARSPEERV